MRRSQAGTALYSPLRPPLPYARCAPLARRVPAAPRPPHGCRRSRQSCSSRRSCCSRSSRTRSPTATPRCKQGDRTALEAGRLSWNPVKHIDPFITILLPLLMLRARRSLGDAASSSAARSRCRSTRATTATSAAATSSSRSPASRRTSSSPSPACCSSPLTGLARRAPCPRSRRRSASCRRCSCIGVLLNLDPHRLQPAADSAARRLARHEVSAAAAAGRSGTCSSGGFGILVLVALLVVRRPASCTAWLYPGARRLRRLAAHRRAPYIAARRAQWLQ